MLHTQSLEHYMFFNLSHCSHYKRPLNLANTHWLRKLHSVSCIRRYKHLAHKLRSLFLAHYMFLFRFHYSADNLPSY